VTAAKRALGIDAYIDAAPVEALGRFCNDSRFQVSVDHPAFDKAGLAQSLGKHTNLIMRQAEWFDVLDEEMYPQAVEDPLGETATELRRMVLSQYAAAKTAMPDIVPPVKTHGDTLRSAMGFKTSEKADDEGVTPSPAVQGGGRAPVLRQLGEKRRLRRQQLSSSAPPHGTGSGPA
jgi:hypothetical protein